MLLRWNAVNNVARALTSQSSRLTMRWLLHGPQLRVVGSRALTDAPPLPAAPAAWLPSSSPDSAGHCLVVPAGWELAEDFPPGYLAPMTVDERTQWPPLVPKRPQHLEEALQEKMAAEQEDGGPSSAASPTTSSTPVGTEMLIDEGSDLVPRASMVDERFRHEPQQRAAAASTCFAKRTMVLGDYGQLYVWLGRVMAFASELKVEPIVEWFYTEVRIWLPRTAAGHEVARYMSEQAHTRGSKRNPDWAAQVPDHADAVACSSSASDSLDTTTTSRLAHPRVLPPDMEERIDNMAQTGFMWCLMNDKKSRNDFNQDIFLQWYHRADYLVSRKSREKKEFRNTLTLDQMMQSAAKRRRRKEARTAKEAAAAKPQPKRVSPAGDEDEEDDISNYAADMLPRELREQLERDSEDGGATDMIRHGKGRTTGSFRTNLFH